jgi:hypothetical protein
MINTSALNVTLRPFTLLCLPHVLATDLQSIALNSNDIVGIRKKIQNVAYES